MKTLVTGGTGFFGKYLVNELLAANWSVRVLARNAARAAALPRDVFVIRGGLDDEGALLDAALGADVVFHLAAATAGAWETHAEVTVEGTRRMLRVCRDAGVRRFVLVSSVAVYDKTDLKSDMLIDESAPLVSPDASPGAYARGKVEAEQIARRYVGRKGGGMEVVIVRPGLIYAAERLAFPHLGELVGATRVAYGSPSLPLPLVEARSCADALVRLGTSPAAAGKTYHVVDACRASRRDYLRALERRTQRRQRVVYLPVWPAAAAAAIVAAADRLARGAKASDVSARKIRSRAVEVRYDTAAVERDTGWRPLRELGEGFARNCIGVRRGTPRAIERVGIVGAGAIARSHLAALRRVPGARVVAVLDTNAGAARALADAAGGVASYSDPARFYTEARPQVVHVLTPPRSHAAVALEALRHGAHVLLEKPATTSPEECDRLLAAADADPARLTIGVDETVAADPLVRRAHAALVHGVIGDLVHVDVFMGCDIGRGGRLGRILAATAWESRLPGGPLEDLLPHPLSVARTLCGPLELRHWQSTNTGRLAGEFPDELRLTLGTGQVTAHVGLSLSARPDDFLVTVHGTRASLRIDVQNMLFDCLTPLPGPRTVARGVRVLRSSLRALGQTGRNAVAVAAGRSPPPASPIHLIVAHHAALARGEPPPATLRAARADIAIARELWPERQPVPIDAHAHKPAPHAREDRAVGCERVG